MIYRLIVRLIRTVAAVAVFPFVLIFLCIAGLASFYQTLKVHAYFNGDWEAYAKWKWKQG